MGPEPVGGAANQLGVAAAVMHWRIGKDEPFAS
jgi:hypothetical protein